MLVIGNRRWNCEVGGGSCTAADSAAQQGGRRRGVAAAPVVVSPDGKNAAFIRNWNLWLRDVATGKETQLTTDGVTNFGYATDNAGWVHSDRPILLWSPDSKRIATQQQEERNVGDMYLLDTRVGHQRLQSWKGPLPGDSVVEPGFASQIAAAFSVPPPVTVRCGRRESCTTACAPSRRTSAPGRR